MEKTRNEIIEDIKKIYPQLSEVEVEQYYEALETFCDIIISCLEEED
jgi:hypothetical protein